MFEIGPIRVIGSHAYGFTTHLFDDGHGGKVAFRSIDFGNEVGRRDFETNIFRLDPVKTNGFRYGRPVGLNDHFEAW